MRIGTSSLLVRPEVEHQTLKLFSNILFHVYLDGVPLRAYILPMQSKRTTFQKA